MNFLLRRVFRLKAGALVLLVGPGVWIVRDHDWLVAHYGGWAVVGAAGAWASALILYYVVFWRCPRCEESLPISPFLRHCAVCGIDLYRRRSS